MMKAATPLVTLAIGLALGLERPALPTLAATALIGLGTAVSTAQEVGSGAWSGGADGVGGARVCEDT